MKPPKPPTKIADLSASLETSIETVTATAAALGIATSGPITDDDATRIAARLADDAQAEADQLRALPAQPTLEDIAKKATTRWAPPATQEVLP